MLGTTLAHLGHNLPKAFPDCRTTYHAVHHGGNRTKGEITNIVLHCTQSETAESTAQYFQNQEGYPVEKWGSANVVVGDFACYRVLDDLVIPYAAPPWNTRGFHIEQAGFVEWTEKEWMNHARTVENAAYRAALRCIWYGIPVVWLDTEMVKDEQRGITSHKHISEAFHDSSHTDPGPNYPYEFFMECVKWYVRKMQK